MVQLATTDSLAQTCQGWADYPTPSFAGNTAEVDDIAQLKALLGDKADDAFVSQPSQILLEYVEHTSCG